MGFRFIIVFIFYAFFIQIIFSNTKAFCASRTVYFAGTSTSNLPYDPTWPATWSQGYILFCTVTIYNFSTTDQVISDLGFNSHSTKHIAGANPANPTHDTDIRLLNHSAEMWGSYPANLWTAAWYKVGYNLNDTTYYWNDAVTTTNNPSKVASAGFRPQKLSALGGTLATSNPNQIKLEPNTMVVAFAKTWVPLKNLILDSAGVPIPNKKFYNFCSGFIKAQDSPIGAQAKNGFLIASGNLEYVADSPLNKPLFYGTQLGNNRPHADSKLYGFATARTTGRNLITVALGNFSLSGSPVQGAPNNVKVNVHESHDWDIFAKSSCTVDIQYNNDEKHTLTPMHVASTPILINGGKPF